MSKTRFFDKLSQNALQNVMQFFDRWGSDFVKMRCINKKTKSAYMAQVSSYAKIEKYLETVDPTYVAASRERLYEFK